MLSISALGLSKTFLFFQFFCSMFDYVLIPKNHSDKWLNGVEWTIDEEQGVTLKTLFEGDKGGKIIFQLEITNNSGEDVNIDPDLIYYRSLKFNEEEISIPNKMSRHSKPVDEEKYRKEEMAKYDTVRIEKADKLLKNVKALVGLGILFDSDNLMINRGYSKIDYYKENLLLKNTIEPGQVFKRIIVIDKFNYITELELVIPIGNITFRIPYVRAN